MTTLAKHFGAELIAAGLNNGLAWGSDGTILGREGLTEQQNSALDALIAAHDPLHVPVIVPTKISKAQAKHALYNAGLLAQVDAEIQTHPYEPIRIWYADANDWYRENPYVLGIALEIGLSSSQVDDLFRAAELL